MCAARKNFGQGPLCLPIRASASQNEVRLAMTVHLESTPGSTSKVTTVKQPCCAMICMRQRGIPLQAAGLTCCLLATHRQTAQLAHSWHPARAACVPQQLPLLICLTASPPDLLDPLSSQPPAVSPQPPAPGTRSLLSPYPAARAPAAASSHAPQIHSPSAPSCSPTAQRASWCP